MDEANMLLARHLLQNACNPQKYLMVEVKELINPS